MEKYEVFFSEHGDVVAIAYKEWPFHNQIL